MSLDISVLTYGLIETLPTRGAFDLLDDFAKPLPALVITRMMGLPDGDAPQLQAWSNAMVAMYRQGRTKEEERAAKRSVQQ